MGRHVLTPTESPATLTFRRAGPSVLIVSAIAMLALVLLSGWVVLRPGLTSAGGADPAAGGVSDGAPCTGLRVAADPSFVPVLERFTETLATGTECIGLDIVAVQGRAAATGLADTGPHVWIPDDVSWIPGADPRITGGEADHPVIATSPVLFALGPDAADRLGGSAATWTGLAAATERGPRVQVAVEDPATSGDGLVAMGGVNESVWAASGRNAAGGAMEAVFAASRVVPDSAALAVSGDEVALVPERALLQRGGPPDGSLVVAPADHTVALRYTWVATTVDADDPALLAARDTLFGLLTSPEGRDALAAAHLRPGDLSPVATPDWVPEIRAEPLAALSGHHVEHVFATFYPDERVADLQVVIDVSNSMWAQPPDSDRPLLDEVKAGVLEIADTLPEAARVGVWEFGTDLDPPLDHRVVVPLTPLTDQGRAALRTGVGGMRPLDTGTGLHDTIAEAYRAARDSTRPGIRSQVVVFTDGRNEADEGSLELGELQARLVADQDEARPVSLAVVVYGDPAIADELTAVLEPVAGSVSVVRTSQDVRNAFIHVAATGLHADDHEGHG
jgi:hypothetical protein